MLLLGALMCSASPTTIEAIRASTARHRTDSPPLRCVAAAQPCTKPTLHFSVVASDQVAELAAWWIDRVCDVALTDSALDYTFHVLWHEDKKDTAASYKQTEGHHTTDPAHIQAVTAAVHQVVTLCMRLPIGSLLLHTDVDVIPLRPYSALLGSEGLGSSRSLLTTENLGRTGRYNSGFVFARVMDDTRALLSRWLQLMLRGLQAEEHHTTTAQFYFNEAVDEKMNNSVFRSRFRSLGRAFAPEMAQVAGRLPQVRKCGTAGRPSTFAYHAVAVQKSLPDIWKGIRRGHSADGNLTEPKMKIVAMARAANISRCSPVDVGWRPNGEALRKADVLTAAACIH